MPPAPPGPPPGPPPGAPPGWRIAPKATETIPEAQHGPEPWADPGNSTADVGMGLGIAGFGLIWFFWPVALPLGVAAVVLGAIGRGKIKRQETRKGRMQVEMALWVGGATIVVWVVLAVAVLVD